MNGVDLHPTLFALLEGGGESAQRVLESLDETLVDQELADPRFWDRWRRRLEHPAPVVRKRAGSFLKAGFGLSRSHS